MSSFSLDFAGGGSNPQVTGRRSWVASRRPQYLNRVIIGMSTYDRKLKWIPLLRTGVLTRIGIVVK